MILSNTSIPGCVCITIPTDYLSDTLRIELSKIDGRYQVSFSRPSEYNDIQTRIHAVEERLAIIERYFSSFQGQAREHSVDGRIAEFDQVS